MHHSIHRVANGFVCTVAGCNKAVPALEVTVPFVTAELAVWRSFKGETPLPPARSFKDETPLSPPARSFKGEMPLSPPANVQVEKMAKRLLGKKMAERQCVSMRPFSYTEFVDFPVLPPQVWHIMALSRGKCEWPKMGKIWGNPRSGGEKTGKSSSAYLPSSGRPLNVRCPENRPML